VLPTLRSRCRLLTLDALGPEEAAAALAALGAPWSGTDRATLAAAAARAGGSVGGALHYLGGERLALDRDVARLMGRLPEVGWRELHGLADRIGADEDDFAVITGAILDWLHARLAAGADDPRRLAPLAEVWENVRRSARDTLALNLDKRAFLLSTFAELAQATRAP
jgi:DNA polymerase-3 subunit delta'